LISLSMLRPNVVRPGCPTRLVGFLTRSASLDRPPVTRSVSLVRLSHGPVGRAQPGPFACHRAPWASCTCPSACVRLGGCPAPARPTDPLACRTSAAGKKTLGPWVGPARFLCLGPDRGPCPMSYGKVCPVSCVLSPLSQVLWPMSFVLCTGWCSHSDKPGRLGRLTFSSPKLLSILSRLTLIWLSSASPCLPIRYLRHAKEVVSPDADVDDEDGDFEELCGEKKSCKVFALCRAQVSSPGPQTTNWFHWFLHWFHWFLPCSLRL